MSGATLLKILPLTCSASRRWGTGSSTTWPKRCRPTACGRHAGPINKRGSKLVSWLTTRACTPSTRLRRSGAAGKTSLTTKIGWSPPTTSGSSPQACLLPRAANVAAKQLHGGHDPTSSDKPAHDHELLGSLSRRVAAPRPANGAGQRLHLAPARQFSLNVRVNF